MGSDQSQSNLHKRGRVRGWMESEYPRIVRGEARGLGAALVRTGLRGLSWGYRLGSALRNWGYDRRWLTQQRAEVPVISVGNLTLGGTGKTPVVEWIARWYREHDVPVAILSRGYGSQEGLNDEGLVLSENLPDVPPLQGKDRAALARIAVEELESQLVILDDGFQHRRLLRDADIVLLDALDPWGSGFLFPRGMLREPPRALGRAHLAVLSRADLIDPAARDRLREQVARWAPHAGWVESRHRPRDLWTGEEPGESLATLAGRKTAAFCGLGNPEGFRRTVMGLNVALAGFRTFPDHHPYTREDLADLTDWARGLDAELVLTTQKDWVKLRVAALGKIPLAAVRIAWEPLSGREALERLLAQFLPKTCADSESERERNPDDAPPFPADGGP